MITKLARGNRPSYFGDSLQSELRQENSDTEDLSDLDISGLSAGTATDTQTDGNDDARGKNMLLNDDKFADTDTGKAMEKRAMRYSVSVPTNSGEQVIQLGSSFQSSVARHLPTDEISKSSTSEDLLEILRERKKSRVQITRAHGVVDKIEGDKVLNSLSPEPADLASPAKLNRSLPTYISLVEASDDDEATDVISKLVGQTSYLCSPSRSSRKVSLQQELCGNWGSNQPARSMRSSVAGEIVRSADSSPLSKGVSPNIPGLVIPDKWKTDFAKQDAVCCSESSSEELSDKSVEEYGSRIALNMESETCKPNPALLGYNLSIKKQKDLSATSESDKEGSSEGNSVCSGRVRRRRRSAERRRSNPQLDLNSEDPDSEEEVIERDSHKTSHEFTPRRDSYRKSLNKPPTTEDQVGERLSSKLNEEVQLDLKLDEEVLLASNVEEEMILDLKIDEKLLNLNPRRESAQRIRISASHKLTLTPQAPELMLLSESDLSGSLDEVSPLQSPIPSRGPSRPTTPDRAGKIIEVGRDGRIDKRTHSPFRYTDTLTDFSEQNLTADFGQTRALQEEMAKSDLLIAELNITIEELKDHNTKLEYDLQNILTNKDSELLYEPLEQSDEYMDLEIELARLQQELTDRDTVIRTQKEALGKTLAKGGSQRRDSLAGAVKQALDVNVTEMARMYNDTQRRCEAVSKDKPDLGEGDEGSLWDLQQKHFSLFEEMGKRHTEEMETLRSDYEVLLELAVREKEDEMRNTIIEDGEMEDLASQVNDLTEEVKKKDSQLQMQGDCIDSLRDQTKRLEALKSCPTPSPQIIIENPEGDQQCEQCVKKSNQIKELSKSSEKTKKNIQKFTTQVNKTSIESNHVFSEVRKSHTDVENDIKMMRCEIDSFASDITSILEAYQDSQAIEISSISTQTASIVLPPTDKPTAETARSVSIQKPAASLELHQKTGDQIFSEKENKYKAELFDLKVKLKESEGKLNHLRRKASETQKIPSLSTAGLSLEQLQLMLREREEALGQARRLHGQNISLMRKRYEKTVRSQQAKIEGLEASLYQLIPEYGSVSNTKDNIADRISVTCRQGRFSACTVITDNLNSR